MEENIVEQNVRENQYESAEPAKSENSENEIPEQKSEVIDSKINKGQSEKSDPDSELILGKFKNINELSKAYEELQKHQGKVSEELGSLRKELSGLDELKSSAAFINAYQSSLAPVIERDKELYNTPEYLQNPIFKEMYSEALIAYGDNLDTDRMVNLLEAYTQQRIKYNERQKSEKAETAGVLDAMTYSKNPQNSIIPPKKNLSEMSEEEFRESIRKLI